MSEPIRPLVKSIRTEHRPSAPNPLPILKGRMMPAYDVILVEVEHFGRQAGGPRDRPVTLEFSVQGDAGDGYRGLDPGDRAAIEARVLEAHNRDLADWRAGD